MARAVGGRRSGYGLRQRLIKRLENLDEQLRSENLSSLDRTFLESQRHLPSGTLKHLSERPNANRGSER